MIQATTKDAYFLFLQGSKCLAQIEANGFRVDLDYLNSAIKEVSTNINTLTSELRQDETYAIWRKRFGSKTNLDSPQQLAEIIFKEMGYKATGYTEKSEEEYKRTGDEKKLKLKADESTFSFVDLPFIKNYFRVKKLGKVLNTYLKNYQKEQVDGYIHCFFHLTTGFKEDEQGGASSYRSSSSDPNLHNVPTRDKVISKYARQTFVPRKGHRLVEVDFKSIEVSVGAAYHKDPMMVKYITDPSTDMHRDMAQQIYQLDRNRISKDIRYVAKNQFVFPEFYGSYYVQCAKHLWDSIDLLKLRTTDNVPLKKHLRSKGIKELGELDPKQPPGKGTFENHLKEVEKDFWGNRFKVYDKWKRDFYQQYLENGYFDFLTGFRIKGIYNRKEVSNYPIQGSAFHCLLWTLIQTQKWLVRNKMRSKIVSQVHDSLIGDIHDNEVQSYLNFVVQTATVELRKKWGWINVPLVVEIECSPIDGNWFQKEPWEKRNGIWGPKEEK